MKRTYILFLLLLVVPFFLKAQNNPEKWKNEISAFENEDLKRAWPENAILFIGSSSIRFWEDLPQRFPEKKIIKRGFGGSETSDLNYYFDRIIYKYKPSEVVIYTGENDIALSNKSTQTVFNDFKTLIDRIHLKLPKTKIIIISLKPSPSRWAKAEEFKNVNKLLKEYLLKTKFGIFVNVFDDMLKNNGQPRTELFKPDNLHMNNMGYDIWEKKLKGLL